MMRLQARGLVFGLVLLGLGFGLASSRLVGEEKGRPALDRKELFFAESYGFLDPPEPKRVGMNLDLDYAAIKNPRGLVNAVDDKGPAIVNKKRASLVEAEEVKRVEELGGVKVGDAITLIDGKDKARPARVEGFSLVGTSSTTVAVMADLVFSGDSAALAGPALALRGEKDYPGPGKLELSAPLGADDPERVKLFLACAGDTAGRAIERLAVRPAVVSAAGERVYFVSYWEHPATEYEIEDVKIAGCWLRPKGGEYLKQAFPLAPLRVFDLDGDGWAEVLGVSGDGTRACLTLVELGPDRPTPIKQGACVGY